MKLLNISSSSVYPGVHKYLLRLNDNHCIESALFIERRPFFRLYFLHSLIGKTLKRRIPLKISSALLYVPFLSNWGLCVSTQIGCPIKCVFCASGKEDFNRNLTVNEIINQIDLMRKTIDLSKYGIKKQKIYFFGVGEPLLNLKNIINSITIIKNQFGICEFAISSIGIVPRIYELINQDLKEIDLYISLHSADENIRKILIPTKLRYPIKKIMKAIDDYTNRMKKRVIITYLLLKNVNDDHASLIKLVSLVKERNVIVNLKYYNDNDISNIKSTSIEKFYWFYNELEKKGIKTWPDFSNGQDIKAGCGQLTIFQTQKDPNLIH